ncbi:MAG: IclR family transcriptional regulator [Candidatus Acidiferrales bacterium]|jgi:IclR family KDG regulon transcriptional repressor
MSSLRSASRLRKRRFVRGGGAPGSSKSLQKALRILVHLGQNGPEMGITQIATALNINKTTTHRLLNAMERFQIIEKNPLSERYRLGLKLHELGTRAVESRTLRSEAHATLLELARVSRESVSLAVPGSGGIMCLDRVDSRDTVIMVRTPVGARFPAHCTAVGKAVLAHLPEKEIEIILAAAGAANGLPRFTPSTLTRISTLKENLRQIVQRGYALDNQELERGLSGVAAPIRTKQGDVIGAVGMAGPTPRFHGKELAKKIALTREAADRISSSMAIYPAAIRES